MKLESKQPEDVIKPEHLKEYERLREDLHERLLTLRNTVFVLQEIAAFPFEDLVDPDKLCFWRLVYWNSVEYMHILIYGLVSDTGPDANTVSRFKNRVLTEWIKDEYKEDFKALLKKVKPDDEMRRLAETVSEIRTHSLAHSLPTKRSQLPDAGRRRVTVEGLAKLCEGIATIFDACNFGWEMHTWFLPYDPASTVGGKRQPTDIEELLDLVARQSGLVNMPEQEYWAVTRDCLSPEQLELMNRYRKKFGLPEI